MKKISIILIGIAAAFSSCKKEETHVSYADQLAKDQTAIQQFLDDNHVTAQLDTSGIHYVVHTQGTGRLPIATDTLALEIEGYLLSTKVIFNADTAGHLYLVPNIITGLKDAILRMPKGSSYTIYIPSGLAFGTSGSSDGTVAANENVYFNLEVLDDDAQLKADVATIDKYVRANEDSVVRFNSGLRMMTLSPGAGAPPAIYNDITVTYTAKFLTTGVQFDTETAALFHPSDIIIAGIRQAVANMRPGGHAIIYIPSKLAYGFSGTDDGVVPRNAILIFDLTLVSVS